MKKLNKKGFTLIELLAVIAILAILIMVLMPSILNLYTSGRKQTFIIQVQNVMKAAETQYMSEQFEDRTPGPYCNTSDSGSSTYCKAKLTGLGDESVSYYVEIDNDGNVSKIQVTDGKYSFEKTSAPVSTNIKKDEIKTAKDSFTLKCTEASTCTIDGTPDEE